MIAESLSLRSPVPSGIELLRERGRRGRPARCRALARRRGPGRPLTSRVPGVRSRSGWTHHSSANTWRSCAPVRREAGHLLPVPRTRASLAVVAEHVRLAMGELPAPLALENAASVFEWPDPEMSECEFLCEIVERTGCLLLLDLANLYVNGHNHGFDPTAALDELPLDHVAYVHVAGGHVRDGVYHDTHADALWPDVLTLVEELATTRRDRGTPARARAQRAAPRRPRRGARRTRAALGSRSVISDSTTPPTRVRIRDRRCSDASRPPCARSGPEGARRPLAGGRPDPPGFRSDRLATTREVLADKRARRAPQPAPATSR